MIATDSTAAGSPLATRIFGTIVGTTMALYYFVFYFPPRLVGSNDPDRYYHLALSQLMSAEGLIRKLPQAEDLGWGAYFPDKEFLFHAITAAGYWLAGPMGTLLVVPVLGIGIVSCIYWILSHRLLPTHAALLTLAAAFLSPVFLFRITMLRPHVLAIFFFCLLLAGILRGRVWLAALAAAGYALSYHAFYMPAIAILFAAAFRWTDNAEGARRWQWAVVGLIVGIILNPYFPSTVVLSWTIANIAMGVGLPPEIRSGAELLPLGLLEYLDYFSFLPLALLATAVLIFMKNLRPSPAMAGFWFLFSLSTFLILLGLKSSRANEYAVPCIILLAGYAISLTTRRQLCTATTCLALVATQGYSAMVYYRDITSQEQGGNTDWYFAAVATIPMEADGQKVFNCEWAAGSYLLFARPGLRFVDLLEPALLWHASTEKYLARESLLRGFEENPRRVLRQNFHADYVLCGIQAFNEQLDARPLEFERLTNSEASGPIQLFRLRDHDESSTANPKQH